MKKRTLVNTDVDDISVKLHKLIRKSGMNTEHYNERTKIGKSDIFDE